jgi:hypothetical protein
MTCTSSSLCKINVGAGSSITCSESADCDIKCQGGCEVTCLSSANCDVTCGDGDAGVAGTECTDTRIVCGSC